MVLELGVWNRVSCHAFSTCAAYMCNAAYRTYTQPHTSLVVRSIRAILASIRRTGLASLHRSKTSRRYQCRADRSDWFWSYMQHHWEITLNAKSALSITGDQLPENESAVVISVSVLLRTSGFVFNYTRVDNYGLGGVVSPCIGP